MKSGTIVRIEHLLISNSPWTTAIIESKIHEIPSDERYRIKNVWGSLTTNVIRKNIDSTNRKKKIVHLIRFQYRIKFYFILPSFFAYFWNFRSLRALYLSGSHLQSTQNVDEIRYGILERFWNSQQRCPGNRTLARNSILQVSVLEEWKEENKYPAFPVSVSKTRFEATDVFPFARPYYWFDDVGLLLLGYFPDKEVQGNAEYLGRPRGYRNKKIIIFFSFFQTTVSSVCAACDRSDTHICFDRARNLSAATVRR